MNQKNLWFAKISEDCVQVFWARTNKINMWQCWIWNVEIRSSEDSRIFHSICVAKGDITNYVWATRDELDRLIDQNQKKKMEEKSRFNWIRLNFHSSVLILWHLDVSVAITPIYAMRSFHFDQLFEPSCPILNCIWFLLSNIEDWSRMIVVSFNCIFQLFSKWF